MYIQILANVHSDTEGNIVKKVSTRKGDLNNVALSSTHLLHNISLCIQILANVHSDTEGNIVKKVSTRKGNIIEVALSSTHLLHNISLCIRVDICKYLDIHRFLHSHTHHYK